MIKEREPALEFMNVVFQVIITLACFYFALWVFGYFVKFPILTNKEYLVVSFIIIPVWFVLLELFDLGQMARIQRYRHFITKYAKVVLSGTFILVFLIQLFDLETFGDKEIVGFVVLNFCFLTGQKLTGRMILKHFRRKGYNSRMILIIADESSVSFIDQIIEMNDWGYIIGGIISNSEEIKIGYGSKIPIYNEEDFTRIIDENTIDEVFFCKQDFNTQDLNKHITECREIGVSFHVHNKVLTFSGLNPKLSFLNRQFFLSFRNTQENYFAYKLKETMDFILTILILVFISPVMLIIALAIKTNDGGPIFFKQVRVGRHGRLFKCLKFRTMVINAEELQEKYKDLNEQEGPVFKIKNDPRITKVGRFLRKTSLDELPQFFNVLIGDMSIVGPRPPVPTEVKQYKRSLNRRLSINPGITCIWQVSGRNNIPFEKWMEMDMEYIDNWSLMLDLRIILKTFKVLLSGNGQ